MFVGLLATGAGHLVAGRPRRGAAFIAVSLASALAVYAAAFVSPLLMLVLGAWSIALFLASLVDLFFVQPRAAFPKPVPLFAVLAAVVVVTRIVPVVVRHLVIEAVNMPSASMAPTLQAGDNLFVDKLSRTPSRGDVVLYGLPADPKKMFVKRVVGIGGDVVETRGDELRVNGELLPATFDANVNIDIDCREHPAMQFTETIAGVPHRILQMPRHASDFLDSTWEVPAGHVFVMGDNRDNSADSRSAGTVPLENVKGRALFVYFSYDGCANTARTDRIGLPIR